MKKTLSLIIGMILLTGCQLTKLNKHITESASTINKHCDLKAFNSIIIAGNAKVELANGDYGIDIAKTTNDQQLCPTKLDNQTLYLDTTFQGLLKVTAPSLKNITVLDNAILSSSNFKSSALAIVAKNYGSINLEGQLNIIKIFQFSNNRINIDWVDSDSLIIKGYGSRPIYLGGVVKNLSVKLINDAKFYARYLRAQKAQIFATDNALAELKVSDTLDAFAMDKSNIYYCQKPKNITVVTKDQSNVLRLYEET